MRIVQPFQPSLKPSGRPQPFSHSLKDAAIIRPACNALKTPEMGVFPRHQATDRMSTLSGVELRSNGQVEAKEILDYIADQPAVWVRVAAVKVNDDWQQAILELTSGAPPTSWKLQEFIYDDALFLAAKRKGSVVARWLV